MSEKPPVWIFSGPTLFKPTPAGPIWQGPARRGDFKKILHSNVAAVALIDGYFGDAPAVTHGEILEIIDQGVAVVGAGSMGALRASELENAGMHGVGRIYSMFKYGVIDGDDEVAVLHAPAELNYTQLTLPLVELRITLELLVINARISPLKARSIIELIAKIPFRERGSGAIFSATKKVFGRDGPKTFQEIEASWVYQKRNDAEKAIYYATSIGIQPFKMDFSRLMAFRTTWAWQQQISDQSSSPDKVSDRELLAVTRFRFRKEYLTLVDAVENGGIELSICQNLATRLCSEAVIWLLKRAAGERRLHISREAVDEGLREFLIACAVRCTPWLPEVLAGVQHVQCANRKLGLWQIRWQLLSYSHVAENWGLESTESQKKCAQRLGFHDDGAGFEMALKFLYSQHNDTRMQAQIG